MVTFNKIPRWPETYWMKGKFEEGDVAVGEYDYNAKARIQIVEGINIVDTVFVDEFTVYENGEEIGGLKAMQMYHEFVDWAKADCGNHRNWELIEN